MFAAYAVPVADAPPVMNVPRGRYDRTCPVACRERPRRRAAEQRDELAPFQLVELHSVPASLSRAVRYRMGRDQSGGNGTILQPVSRWRGRPVSEACVIGMMARGSEGNGAPASGTAKDAS